MDHAPGLIAKALKVLFGTPPYFGHIDPKPISHAESVAMEAENSPKSVAEVRAERARKSDLAIERLRRVIGE